MAVQGAMSLELRMGRCMRLDMTKLRCVQCPVSESCGQDPSEVY